MKKLRKIACICVSIFILAASPVFSDSTLELDKLQSAINDFSESLATSLPFNSTVGLNWSDAYIGQLIGKPPHFGFGLSAGVTSIDSVAIDSLLGAFDVSGLNLSLPIIGFPLPAYTFDLRLGGFGIPFDFGFKFGILDTSKIDMLASLLTGMKMDYMLIGGDFRYALLNGKGFPVRLSVGGGFNHIRGGLSTSIGDGFEALIDDPQGGNDPIGKLTIDAPELGLIWQSNVIEAKAQVSFPLVIITPYAGIGVSYAWSKAGYYVKSQITVDDEGSGYGSSLNGYIDILADQYGISGLSGNGFESINEINGFNFRAFGGISLNLAVIKIDMTIMYNFKNAFGATVGLRFQL